MSCITVLRHIIMTITWTLFYKVNSYICVCVMVIPEYNCHVYVRGDNLAGVLLSDQEYPHRVAHTLITKVLDEFAAKIPSHEWPTLNEASVSFPQLNVYLAKYQNPREADAMTKIQEELDETKIILVSIKFVKCYFYASRPSSNN